MYVSGNLLVYYVEGNPRRCVAPDAFVVLDCDPSERRTFKIWEERRAPTVVWEVTSKYTRKEDSKEKIHIYAEIGVKELFLYDPTADYLKPPLVGYRLNDDGARDAGFVRIEPDDLGAIHSAELGISMRLEGGALILTDVATGKRIVSQAEAEEVRANTEEVRANTEAMRANTEETRANAEETRANAEETRANVERAAREAAEEEVRRLRAIIERGRGGAAADS